MATAIVFTSSHTAETQITENVPKRVRSREGSEYSAHFEESSRTKTANLSESVAAAHAAVSGRSPSRREASTKSNRRISVPIVRDSCAVPSVARHAR